MLDKTKESEFSGQDSGPIRARMILDEAIDYRESFIVGVFHSESEKKKLTKELQDNLAKVSEMNLVVYPEVETKIQ